MGVEFADGACKRGETLYHDYPENILIEPELNGRHEHTDVEILAADIEKFGQRTPVTIRKNDDNQAVLVFGHRRYRAVALLNERNPASPRKLTCRYEKLSESEAFVAAIGENRFRRDVSPIDDCANIMVLKKRFGKTNEDVAEIYFPEARTDEERAAALKFVTDREALDELAPEAAQAVRDGRIKLTAAKGLAKLTKAQQRAKVAGGGKVKGKDLKPAGTAKKTPSKKGPEMTDNTLRGMIVLLLEDIPVTELNGDAATLKVSRPALLELWEFMNPVK